MPEQPVQVGRAQARHLNALVQLCRSVGVASLNRPDYPPEQRQLIAAYCEEQAGAMAIDVISKHSDHLYWAASLGGKVVGMCGYYMPAKTLHSVYVSEPKRNCGVGSTMIRHVLADQAVDAQCNLWVEPDNAGAIRFYNKRFNFRLTNNRETLRIGRYEIPERQMVRR
jgi:ribosomal protein S18 acetylase RimI-like enzyme